MSTIDTSTWSPDSNLNTDIGGIPLNADASIQQTWQAIQMLMAALKGDTSEIKLTINQADGVTIVATNQTLTVVDNAHAHTIANVAGLQSALDGKASSDSMEGATASSDGASGLVPQPLDGDQDKLLKGDGTWSALAASQIPGLDASKIASGTIDLARLPAGALERLVTVADQTARFALTTADVQLGDTVKQTDTGLLYFVVDTANLDSASGYVEYTAGAASAVPWTGVTGKPSTFDPSSHTHGNLTNGGELSAASRAVVTDSDRLLDVSSVTATELGYLSGVTSAIQTQLDAKAADSGVVHNSGNETIGGTKTLSSSLVRNGTLARSGAANGSISLCNGSGASDGGGIWLYGKSHSTAGKVRLQASNGTDYRQLDCNSDGTLTWMGQTIQTSSDERLKTPMQDVPDVVLDAWESVHWGQFQFLDAVGRKGEVARLHLGLIAQRVKAVFGALGLDACSYGILCYEAEEDLWMVRYEEALAMEAACQRRRADRLEARIKALEEKLHV